MARLEWDKTGERQYETGVDHVVLYVSDNGLYPKGVAWNGVTAINESPSGAEPSPLYADNIKYLNMISAEELSVSLEAYSSPEEFDECDGSKSAVEGVTVGQQDRKMFGLAFRTIIGNDVDNNNHGYALHLIYGCLAAPSEKAHATVNDSPEPATLSWEISTTPVNVNVEGMTFKPTASLEINSLKANKDKLAALETVLFGSEQEDAKLPLPGEVIAMMKTEAAAG